MEPPSPFISEERTPLGSDGFQFHCHPQVPCYLICCHNVDMLLYPYDILRLKQHLALHSSEFLYKYTRICEGSHPFFPGLKLNMAEEERNPCPFLNLAGCSVYKDRPSACRTYPLERGLERPGNGQELKVHYSLTHHHYCQGHKEPRLYSIKLWEREQDLYDFNLHNDLWAELDAFFSTNPWSGEGKAGPMQQLAFMVCYNIDGFRDYVESHSLIDQYRLSKDERRRIIGDDSHLLRFGFHWLEHLLGGRKLLVKK